MTPVRTAALRPMPGALQLPILVRGRPASPPLRTGQQKRQHCAVGEPCPSQPSLHSGPHLWDQAADTSVLLTVERSITKGKLGGLTIDGTPIRREVWLQDSHPRSAHASGSRPGPRGRNDSGRVTRPSRPRCFCGCRPGALTPFRFVCNCLGLVGGEPPQAGVPAGPSRGGKLLAGAWRLRARG